MCTVVVALFMYFFLRRIVLCAILLYFSIVVIVVVALCVSVSVWVFYTYLYCRHLWNFNSHFVVVSQSPSLSRSRVRAPTALFLSLSLEHTYSHTDTTCSRTRRHTSLAFSLSHARECYVCHSLNATTGARSLSLSLVHFERAHILLFRHLRQKQNSQGWWHNISFDSVAISAVSVPPPYFCICVRSLLLLFCVGVALAALACRLQHVRFPVYFLSIAAAASTRRQTSQW